MRSFAILGLLAFTACAARGQANPQTPTPSSVPSIVASGESQRSVAPDQVTIILGVLTRSRTPLAAAGENAERMNRVLAALRQLGLTDQEVTTSHYSVHSEIWRNENDTVHVATNSVRVQTKKLDLLARVIESALSAGATNVSSLEFGLENRSGPTREALADAVREARLQAEAMAAAAGGRLGALEELTTQPTGYQPFMARDMAVASMQQGAAPPITPGEVILTAIVTGRWRFIPER
ncbi:MAG TPA: SIMPL domain-containing protein [Gemmatimonadaceae bacterium]|nr:SIMPL domain-containing protein [Gemmatimonadaceae bacterium]